MARESRGSEQTFAAVAARFLRDVLRPDLARMADEPAVSEVLHAQWEAAAKAGRTGETEREYREYALEQIGAAWVLSALFLRVLEDRGMVDVRRVAGGGATDEEELFRELFPNLGPREYLLTAFKEVSQWPGGAEVLGPAVNPAWRLYPSQEAVRGLLDLFREADAQGVLRYTFEGSDTRFLGDLYEQLSAGIRARFALLQTPDFVEAFILSRTLDPALAAFGLDGLRVLDPTCGSGHFLLGAFHRLLAEERRARPDLDAREHVVRALAHVHGSDINPYAVAIARLRLALAAAEACGVTRLEDLPRDDHGASRLAMLRTNVVVADSLVAGAHGQMDLAAARQSRDAQRSWGTAGFDLEDPEAVRALFAEGFHAVVGNPPYIASDDEALRKKYRELYPKSAKGKYTLSAPFTERFFSLATRDGGGGFVGLINSNAFLKREFGKGLIEQVLPGVDLTEVVDTSGAYIPGHGTPTVILFGRNRAPQGEAVTVVMGRRGEPETPEDAAKGKVWSSIAAHDGEVGYEDGFITVAEVKRAVLAKHPWSLGGGGAKELKERIEQQCHASLSSLTSAVGFDAIMGEDDIFVAPLNAWRRVGFHPDHLLDLVTGDTIRDWSIQPSEAAIFPYDAQLDAQLPDDSSLACSHFWQFKSNLIERRQFGKNTIEAGLKWFEYRSFYKSKRTQPLSITFAEVSTHNHFVLDRGGKVFKQTAPVIKLRATATEEDHLALLGWLNSSSVCFWLKQVCMNKGIRGEGGGLTADTWEQFHQFASTKLQALGVPSDDACVHLARSLDSLARDREASMPTSLLARYQSQHAGAAKPFLSAGRVSASQLLHRMVALQEELDWRWYDHLGLLSDEDRERHRAARDRAFSDPMNPHPLRPGHRAFERAMHLSGEATAWFSRNGYALPTNDALAEYPEAVRDLIALRVELIASDRALALLERPEHKRRWTLRDYDAEAREAARGLLLDRVEARVRSEESPVDARTLVHALLADPTAQELAAVCFPDAIDPMEEVPSLIASESADYLAAMRHTEEGLSKRTEWERTWALQRREDAGEVVGDIPVPPKYGREDYREARYWSLRGKLDVPRERFIAYPGAETDPRAPLFGWAGWDHLQRARALATLYTDRKNADAWDRDRLRPLLAGIAELVPWLLQWHDAPDPELDGQGHGRLWKEFVENERHGLRWTEEELRAWRPATGARKKATKSKG